MSVPGLPAAQAMEPRVPLPAHEEVQARIRRDKRVGGEAAPLVECMVPRGSSPYYTVQIVFERMSDFLIQQIYNARPKGLLYRGCIRFLTGTAAFFMTPLQAITLVGIGAVRLAGLICKKDWGKATLTSLQASFRKNFSIIAHREPNTNRAEIDRAGDAQRQQLERAFALAAPLERRLARTAPGALFDSRPVILTNVEPLVAGANLREAACAGYPTCYLVDPAAELVARNVREAAEHSAAAASLGERGIERPEEFAAAGERAAAAHQRADARRRQLLHSRAEAVRNREIKERVIEIEALPEDERNAQIARLDVTDPVHTILTQRARDLAESQRWQREWRQLTPIERITRRAREKSDQTQATTLSRLAPQARTAALTQADVNARVRELTHQFVEARRNGSPPEKARYVSTLSPEDREEALREVNADDRVRELVTQLVEVRQEREARRGRMEARALARLSDEQRQPLVLLRRPARAPAN